MTEFILDSVTFLIDHIFVGLVQIGLVNLYVNLTFCSWFQSAKLLEYFVTLLTWSVHLVALGATYYLILLGMICCKRLMSVVWALNLLIDYCLGECKHSIIIIMANLVINVWRLPWILCRIIRLRFVVDFSDISQSFSRDDLGEANYHNRSSSDLPPFGVSTLGGSL